MDEPAHAVPSTDDEERLRISVIGLPCQVVQRKLIVTNVDPLPTTLTSGDFDHA
jgi:hypothetical protein